MDKNITIDQVLKMEKPIDKFILTLEDNTPGIRFNGFKLRNMETGEVYHEYYPNDIYELDYFADHELEYAFSNKLITKVKTIGSTLNLVVGNQVVKNLVLIERHYVEGKHDVVKKIENKEDVNAKSDTFIFVEGKLVVHRRARYVYYCD